MVRNQAISSHSIREGLSGGFPSEDYITWWQSERPCPKCRAKLNTNGQGVFTCPRCQYTDNQDVSKLYALGLDYVSYIHARGAIGQFGKKSMRKAWR